MKFCCADVLERFAPPTIPDVTRKRHRSGYPQAALKEWASRAQAWAFGSEPQDLPKVTKVLPSAQPRDVFLFFISGAKERAPLAARELAEQVRDFNAS